LRDFFHKNIIFVVFFVALSFSLTVFGSARIGAEKRDSLSVNSSVILEGTEVKNSTHVEGMLIGKKAALNIVTVDGSAQFKNSHITGKTIVNGAFRFGEGETGELVINGGAEIVGAIIRGASSIDGALSSTKTTFLEALDVNGVGKLIQSHVKGKLTLDGSLFAQSSIFEQEILIGTNQATFVDCKLAGIIIRKGGRDRYPQQLILKGNRLFQEIFFLKLQAFLFL
jgi:hypothetical protein